MNYNRVHSLLSKASEAIVSSDGRIKRRLNNYETVVEPGKDPDFYMPDGAVNDNYGNLNFLTSEIRKQNVNARLSKLRYSMFAAFGVVILVFLWSVYNFLIPSFKNSNSNLANGEQSVLATTVNEVQLERIANLIIIDDEWSKTRLNLFNKYWNASSDEARNNYKTTAWFQQFSFRLESKFNRSIYTGELFSDASESKKHPIYQLALMIGVADPNINYSAGLEKNKNYLKLENEVASELAKMEQTHILAEENDKQIVSDEQSLAKLLTDKNGKPLLPGTKPEEKSPNTATQDSQLSTEKTESIVTAAAPPAISEQDVSRVFEKYASAYEKGSLEELSTLFGVKDPEQGKHIIEQLKANYETVFANSQKRSVNFRGINWRFDGDTATVNSDYSAEIELKNNKGKQTVTANALIDLKKSNDQLKIASFELLNRSINVVTPELNTSASKTAPRKRPDSPTAAELQDIVTRLISSYESGDINAFSSLFARNAKTNDRQDLGGIRDDYRELFANSNDRQMFIQGMKWSFDEKYAKGIGNLEAIVLTGSGNSVYSLNGKIQLVAQRIDGKVKITHMYHIEREK